MDRKYLLIIFAFLMAILVHSESHAISLNSDSCVTKEQLNDFLARAAKNDIYAVRRLQRYYGACIGDVENTYKYAKLGAEIGLAKDVRSYATALADTDSNKQLKFSLYLKAARMGDSYSKLIVAEAYRDGDGVDKDPAQALVWFQLAATCQEFGTDAMEEMAELIWKDKTIPLAGPKALAWLNVVDHEKKLGASYQDLRDEIRGSLSKDEIDIANQIAPELIFDAGCK